jgi:uncharacterized membrane protein
MNRTPEKKQSRMTLALTSAALGALSMYYYDPERGRRRRALVHDQINSAVVQSCNAVDVASRDLGNRLEVMRGQASGMLSGPNANADDRVIEERVRATIGRAVSNSRAISVTVHQGRVDLSGAVLSGEKQSLINAAYHVRGVKDVEDNLETHDTPDGVPSLQGLGASNVLAAQDNWPPALRAGSIIGAIVLGIYALTKRTPAKLLLSIASVALATRSTTDKPLIKASQDAGQHTVHLEKSIRINASPEQVFDIWSQYENFPRFMSNVKKVTGLGNNRSHWVVSGPAGATVEWDARTTESRRPEVLAWRSEPGSSVQNGGRIRFEPDGDGTRVTVHMSYTPPASAIGHVVASMFGKDPKRQMDDDLMRMKSFIETGKPPSDAAKRAERSPSTLH